MQSLRWLKTVSSTFQDVDFDVSLLPLFINCCYNHGIKKKCPIIGEHVGIIILYYKIPYMEFRATLNFKILGGSELHVQNFFKLCQKLHLILLIKIP